MTTLSTLESGATLEGRYQLQDVLGRGGLGIVYRAHDTLLDRPVAVKVMADQQLGEEHRARLLQEARSAAQLQHPNIVTIFDAGESGDFPFIVMELVSGQSLHERPPETLGATLAVAEQICVALAHAHAHGIVHRDLKPENVVVALDGSARLMDFGLARSIATRLTGEGTLTGTVFYLAPELALGHEFDGRADLYALGVMLYELAAGRLPFEASDPLGVISQHLHAPVVPPRAHNDRIPPALETLILQLLSKRPDDRPDSAGEVLEALRAIETRPTAETDAAQLREISLLERIVRGRLVGRERELGQAHAIWVRAQASEGQLLLISGEPGIGKTRLVRELVTRIEVAGGTVLVGECYQEGGAPYGPFSQIVRRALQNGSAGIPLPDFVLADLLSLAPGLRLEHPDVPPNPPLDPQAEQSRLYENVVNLCTTLADHSPLALVIEDVHWADSGTLSLLRHLSRRLRSERVMLVATYREVELDQARPFQATLVDLNRGRLATRLKLTRFDRSGTEKLLAALFGEEITPDFLDGIFHETEGNPFFVEEVVKALIEEGKLYFQDGRWVRPPMEELLIPQSVRMAIQSRVGLLPDSAQETLTLAAILGREFDFEALSKASDLGEGELVEALELADRAQLIEETSGLKGGTFRFAHALIPTTLVDALSGLRRRRMHRQVAEVLAKLRPDDFQALAHHYSQSGELQKALEYSILAGQLAGKLYAADAAMEHYEQARELAETLQLPEQLAAIHEAIGDVQSWNEINYAIDAYQQALELVSSPQKKAQLEAKIGGTYTSVGDEQGLPFLEAAIQGLDRESQGNELAVAISSIGRFHHYRGHHMQAITHFERALEIAEELGDSAALSLVYSYLSGAHQHLADFPRSMEWAWRIVELGRKEDNPIASAMGYEFLAEASYDMGLWQEAENHGLENLRIGREAGIQPRIAWAQFSLLLANFGRGDLETALKYGQSAQAIARDLGELRLSVISSAGLALAYFDLGDFEKGQAAAQAAAAQGDKLGQVFMVASGRDAVAYAHSLRGEWAEARKQLEPAVELMDRTDSRVVPMTINPRYAEICLRTGSPEEALERANTAIAIAQAAPSEHFEAVGRKVLSLILAERGDEAGATAALDRAIEAFERLESRLELAHSHLQRGRRFASLGNQGRAREDYQRALDLYSVCHAGHWISRTQEALDDMSGQAPSHESHNH